MKSINLPKPSVRISRILPGLILTSGLAILATLLHHVSGLKALSPLILAVVLGILMRNLVGLPPSCKAGITFSLKRILRLAIILLGLQLSFMQILAVGPAGLAIVIVTTVSTFLFTCWLGQYLGIKRKLTQLIAAGTSICGASAVVATNGILESSDEDVAYAVTVVTVFGTLSIDNPVGAFIRRSYSSVGLVKVSNWSSDRPRLAAPAPTAKTI
ncbi:MAG: YeiH family protein [Xenococcaceae cyanobacterium]